ncbi:hypothetical protein mRhiFer1_009608 [Rhinolophus ferrumequinum]|uniref:Uncharacterized protein n=1 Tax=Rhinolophus ferrumequinum TaxID=59479 RepID=A0A7J7ZQ32_RHIFE|nr:hypothetical protein mRhiFer1_009608 [Rhinolophus ferrumequinum]
MVKINFFRTLEINHRLATTQRVFIQENLLNVGKDNDFSGILICPYCAPSPLQLCSSRETQQSWNQSLWEKNGSGALLKASFAENCPYEICLAAPLHPHTIAIDKAGPTSARKYNQCRRATEANWHIMTLT